jgi:pyruvate/2-oxoglutarate/acetoin dehydrogenase E1 component
MPVPFSPPLEQEYMVDVRKIVKAVEKVVSC